MSLRIALYSPGMVGLGHMRRNLLLARRFMTENPDAAILMIAEAREACAFRFPDRVDCVSLPAIRKDPDGSCSPRYLGVGIDELVRLRSEMVRSALLWFRPDVLIVDHLPLGALRELEPALAPLRNGGTRLVLGLRDVLEDPQTVRREWAAAGNERAIDKWYDEVWVYGDPAVFDAPREYGFTRGIADRMYCTGYLNPRDANPDVVDSVELLAHQALYERRLVLCQVGGGQDGMAIADSFTRVDFPRDTQGVLLLGPFMPTEARVHLRQRARTNDRLEVLDYVTEPLLLLQRADQVITMGGYNSICEVLAFRKTALVVPRTHPRCEQLIRAERLAGMQLVDMLLPDAATPEALADWLAHGTRRTEPRQPVDMAGLDRACERLASLANDEPVRSGTRVTVKRPPEPAVA
jgi:predicted glycosyltransferase